MTKPEEPDIVQILEFWAGADDIPPDVRDYLSAAADEIRGLREENKYYKKILDDAEPRF